MLMRNRAAVPLFPRKIGLPGGARFPPVPVTTRPSPVERISAPRTLRASIKYSVSSEIRGPCRRDFPSAREAITRALWVQLFDPGTRTEALRLEMGCISIGSDMESLRSFRVGAGLKPARTDDL
jgi:hypothetical protein